MKKSDILPPLWNISYQRNPFFASSVMNGLPAIKTERLAQRVEELRHVAGEEAVRHVLTRLGETMPSESPLPQQDQMQLHES